MHVDANHLGKIVRNARKQLGLTQKAIAEAAGIDERTVLNIEKGIGNPKMEVLLPLIRILKIDANDLFYPELKRDYPSLTQLRLLIEDCNEEEAAAILPAVKGIINVLRRKTISTK